MHRVLPLLVAAALAGCGLSSDPGDPGDLQPDGVAAMPASTLFDAALCLCDDFNDVGLLKVLAGPAGTPAVGVNGHTRFVNATYCEGDWDAWGGFDAVAGVNIEGGLHTAASARWTGLLSVGGDLAVGGDALGIGALVVGGTLRVAGQEALLGLADVAARGPYAAPAGPPCPCDPATFFDVGAAVAAAATANDNASIGLPADIANIGVTSVALPTGTYYIRTARTVGLTKFEIEGDVSLFVDGSLDTVGLELFRIAPGATLDLFVSGAVRTVGHVRAGTPDDPGAFHLYIGGSDPVSLSVGLQQWYGSIYAPSAVIAYVGDTHVVGSLFARRIHGVGRLVIEYGATPPDPDSCEPPPPDDGDDDDDTPPPDDGDDDDTPPDDGGDDLPPGDDDDDGGSGPIE